MRRWFPGRVALLVATLALGCSPSRPYAISGGPRDWAAHPAVVEIDGAAPVLAMSDVHGGYDRMVALLVANGVIAAVPASPRAITWSAGEAVLVVTGDLIDKGSQSVEVLDALMALEQSAASVGGRVVVTLGNHEAEFFVDPGASKASELTDELKQQGIDPLNVASGADPRGRWLRERPFAARVGHWFFAHAGDTGGRSITVLSRALRAAIDAHDYDDPEIIGSRSILESRDWFDASGAGAINAKAASARHIVFGHDPHALGPDGQIGASDDGVLFRIDCGMSPAVDYSEGCLLRVRIEAGTESAESLDAKGNATPLWKGPAG